MLRPICNMNKETDEKYLKHFRTHANEWLFYFILFFLFCYTFGIVRNSPKLLKSFVLK